MSDKPMTVSDERLCHHLMHLPSGKCLGCGEQHQPLADYQPGDDEKYTHEHLAPLPIQPDPLADLEYLFPNEDGVFGDRDIVYGEVARKAHNAITTLQAQLERERKKIDLLEELLDEAEDICTALGKTLGMAMTDTTPEFIVERANKGTDSFREFYGKCARLRSGDPTLAAPQGGV